MRPYSPETNKGRHLAGHDVHHKTADQPKTFANASAKKLKKAARQEGHKAVRGELLDAVRATDTQVVLPDSIPSGMCLVNAGALQMVINALRRDAEEGKVVRGEMADELLATVEQAQADALDAARYRFLRDTCWSSDKELATVISL